MLAPLQRQLALFMARLTFQPQHLLLGCLSVFSEDRFGLTTITSEFHMVPSFSQSFRVTLASFVLGNLVLSVSFASVVLAECSSDFGNVDHLDYCNNNWLSAVHF